MSKLEIEHAWDSTTSFRLSLHRDGIWLVLDEQDFNAIETKVRELRLARQAEKERREREEIERAYAEAQRTETVEGLAIRVQLYLPEHGSEDRAVWLDGHDRDASPFVLVRDFALSRFSRKGAAGRDWVIEVEWHSGSYGHQRRKRIVDARGNEVRFGTWQAALARAMALGLHTRPPTTKPETKTTYA